MNVAPESILIDCAGTYSGPGINHEEAAFTGLMTLAAGEGYVALEFSAVGADGTLYHREESRIESRDGTSVLIVRSSNHPSAMEHELRYTERTFAGARTYVFGHGDTEERDTFREEITLTFHENGDIGYDYAWGMPGGEFADRSSARMAPPAT
ncbi:MAG TPA: hypothetical protein VHI13_15625 [Candidatus Kapabacteria bacterium]|nr:hypothetical protein [Candidatus Kapabacteria bacterium]